MTENNNNNAPNVVAQQLTQMAKWNIEGCNKSLKVTIDKGAEVLGALQTRINDLNQERASNDEMTRLEAELDVLTQRLKEAQESINKIRQHNATIAALSSIV